MATPDDIHTDLTLDLGDDLAPEEFVAAVRNFLGYVAEITESQKGDGAVIDWKVRVKQGSNLIGVEPTAIAPPSRLAMIYKQADFGVRALAKGDVEGSGLPEKAITHLKGISDIAAKQSGGNGIRIWVKKQAVGIGGGISKAIQEDSENDYFDFGTIEGRLEAIQDASGSLKIKVRDFLYPRPITCLVREDMIDKVLSSFRRRVEIEGKIHYRKNGTPISIEASVIDELPEDDELPSAADVRGILASA